MMESNRISIVIANFKEDDSMKIENIYLMSNDYYGHGNIGHCFLP